MIFGALGQLALGEFYTSGSVVPSGVATEEAFGTVIVYADGDVFPSSVVTEETFGTAVLVFVFDVTGIATAQAFGTAIISTSFPTVSRLY